MPIRPLFRRLPRLLILGALALAAPLFAEDHLTLGREALRRADYPAAVEHLQAASRDLEGGDREKLSEVQTDLGIAYLTGLSRPADALRAFVRAADLAKNPATAWLWASTAALQMGDEAESERYKRLALGGRAAATPEPVAVAVEPAVAAEPAKSAAPEPAGAVEKAEAPPTAAKAKDLKDSRDSRDEKKKPEKQTPEAAPPAQPAGSAFDHFFKRRPADEPQEPAAGEPPPGGVSGRS
ncbi:MAG TPA: hypothetical protein VN851_13555 [Thermoanaerobaculia bacterium]|nr:hypothetical protein [Thermoanaerobaculia bacterium]